MHLLQRIKALSTGIYCHLALVGAGRPLHSLPISYETRCSLRLFHFHIFTSKGYLKDNNPQAESMEQYRFMLWSSRSRRQTKLITRMAEFSLHGNRVNAPFLPTHHHKEIFNTPKIRGGGGAGISKNESEILIDGK